MSWSSASDIFDPVAGAIADGVEGGAISYERGKAVLAGMIGKLQESDWDGEEASLLAFQDRAVVVDAFAYCGIELEDTGEPDYAAAKQAILDFSWSNYGLDEVEETKSDDWAEALAKAVLDSQVAA